MDEFGEKIWFDISEIELSLVKLEDQVDNKAVSLKGHLTAFLFHGKCSKFHIFPTRTVFDCIVYHVIHFNQLDLIEPDFLDFMKCKTVSCYVSVSTL